MWGFLCQFSVTFLVSLLVIGVITSFFWWIYVTISDIQFEVKYLRERIAVLESKQGGSLLDSLFMSAMPYAAAAAPTATPPPEETDDTTTFELSEKIEAMT